jgi:hypothetical protein
MTLDILVLKRLFIALKQRLSYFIAYSPTSFHPSQLMYSVKGAENSSDYGVVNSYSSRPKAPACDAFN